MALEYGPFNGLENAWDAYDFAEYFKLFYGNGVFPNPSNNLQVVTNANMQTKVSVGVGFVEGHKIKNTSEFILQHDVADGVLKRIDRVVMRANFLQNKGEIIVKKGTPASSPVAPTLVRNTDYYELALADVLINNGATTITQANITDQRLNTALCGVVATNITQLDTTTLALQYQAAFEQMTIEQQQEFEAWIATLEDILDENVATTLASRLLTVEGEIDDLQSKTQVATNAEAIAGTNNTKVMTPLRTNEAITNKALLKTGGIITGDLTIQKALPLLKLMTPNQTYSAEILLNANNTNDLGTFIRVNGLDNLRLLGQKNVQFLGNDNVWTSLQDLKSSVSNGKAQVAAAITGKGVTTAADATFATLTNNVNAIQTGSKVASGTYSSTTNLGYTVQGGNSRNLKTVVVSGLTFRPSKIILSYTQPSGSTYVTTYEPSVIGSSVSCTEIAPDIYGTTSYLVQLSGNANVSNNGFTLPIAFTGTNTISINWTAIQ